MTTYALGGLLTLLAATVGICVVLAGCSAWWRWSPEADQLRVLWRKLTRLRIRLDD